MPLITRSSQNANVKVGTTAQLAVLSFVNGDLASDTDTDKLQIFNGSSLTSIGTSLTTIMAYG
jgi:hypothetical protein